MIARTLFTGLSDCCWKLWVSGLGGRVPVEFVTYSRVPVAVVKGRVSFGKLPDITALPKPVLVVDPKGKPIDSFVKDDGLRKGFTLVVDYTGSLKPLIGRYQPVSSLRLNLLTYEAIAVIYATAIRVAEPPEARNEWRGRLEVREALYLARRLIDSLRICDSIPTMDFHEVAYTLRNMYMRRRILLDLEEAETIYRAGSLRVRLRLGKYHQRDLKRLGTVELVLEGSKARLIDDGETLAEITVDLYERRACLTRDLCVTAETREPEATIPDFMF